MTSHRFASAQELEAFAARLSLFARPGMVLLLQGDLGAGKSTFARAFIRALAGGMADFDVPSPTFTLVQSYTETRIPVLHADLYRIGSDGELAELGLDEQRSSHVLLVEWPERLLNQTWPDTLHIEFKGGGATRDVTWTATGAWNHVLARSGDIENFLSGTRWSGAARRFLEGDASFRRYETLVGGGGPAVLMDMQARPDGPIVKNGLPYSAIAHLAEDIRAVVAVNAELVSRGLSAPRTLACDLGAGLAIIEDLGRNVYAPMLRAGHDMREPLGEAVAVLAQMADSEWPATVALPGGGTYAVPRYDIDAQMIEVDLLPSWFWPYAYTRGIAPDQRAEFEAIWQALLPLTQPARRVWVLRDYHSPNLLWLPDRHAMARVGIIDTQDAVLGHPAYDLASLLQDARVDIAFDLADHLFERYCALRPDLDRAEFAAAYAILGAQRATKILGIFARLSKRDGKHGYLQHMPRVSRYLERNLCHPALAELKRWFDTHLPASTRERRP